LKKLNKYYTGLIAWDSSLYPPPPYKGKGWIVDLEKTKKCKTGSVTYDGKKMKNLEVTLYARNFENAQNVLEMINSSILLSTAQPLVCEIQTVIPKDKKEYAAIFSDHQLGPEMPTFFSSSGFPVACMIAAKASHRKSYKYALTKFGLASRLHSVWSVDIDPSSATEHLGVSPFVSDHVRYAYAIIASYATIEEIGLEIRASSTNPSTINGNWNPIVRNDVEERLRKAGVDPEETFPWDLRGKPTRIEKSRRLPSKGKCSWAKGPYVRDCELEMVDAINIASFLRSKISSHKMSKIASSVTSYDVENVRMLARRLLLGILGFWPPYKKSV
jgi:hypothetical protein